MLSIIEEEFDAVKAAFGPLDQIQETPYWSPDVAELDLVLRRAPDRGNTPASHAVRDFVEDFMPEALMLLGICAGIKGEGRDEVRLGDVVVPTYLHYAEFVKVAPEGRLKRYSPYDHPSVSLREVHVEGARVDGTWKRDLPVEPPAPADPPELVYGSLVSSEKILSNPNSEEQREIVGDYPDAVALDMESFGAAKALHLARAAVGYNPRFLVIRGVSDLIYAKAEDMPEDHQNPEERRIWKAYAAANATALAHDVVGRFLGAADDRDQQRRGESHGV